MRVKRFHEYNLILEAQQSLKLNVPKDVKDLHKLFKKNKKQLYIVGGAVRDALLGIKPKDFDLATDALPKEVIAILRKGNVETIGEVGQQFGVVIAKTPSFAEGMEIATFRKDIGKGRRPDAVEYSTIDKDVLRRDLTINALFYDIDREEVVDLVGGVADIQSNTIRTVGRAQERFDEDRLRILRALRFAGRTGSKLEKNTAEAILADNSLEGISGERTYDEFKKSIISAKSVKAYLEMVSYFDLWGVMFPGLEINTDFNNSKSWIIQIASLFMDNDQDFLKKRLNALKFSGDDISGTVFLKSMMDFQADLVFDMHKSWMKSKVSSADLLDFAKIHKLDLKTIKAFTKYKPSTNGGDIVKEFGLKGAAIGDKIKEVEAEKFKSIL